MGPISAGVRQLPYQGAIVAQRQRDASGSHDIVSWEPTHRPKEWLATPLLEKGVDPFVNLGADVVGVVNE